MLIFSCDKQLKKRPSAVLPSIRSSVSNAFLKSVKYWVNGWFEERYSEMFAKRLSERLGERFVRDW